jgi:hypothetical protein
MANKRNRSPPGEGTRKKLAQEQAAEAAAAALRAKAAARRKAARLQKKLAQAEQTKEEKDIAREVRQLFKQRAGHLSSASQGAILRLVLEHRDFKPLMSAKGTRHSSAVKQLQGGAPAAPAALTARAQGPDNSA